MFAWCCLQGLMRVGEHTIGPHMVGSAGGHGCDMQHVHAYPGSIPIPQTAKHGVKRLQGVERLWAGYKAFRKESYGQQRALFSRLARGQSPDVMIFACADSRADPALIFSASPGELFVYRNVANLVPAYQQSEQTLGAAAALEFAVEHLKVKDIVVMGHASCGGINASLASASGQTAGSFIAPWVAMLDPVRDQVIEDNRGLSEEKVQSAMEHAGVSHSIGNIASYPFAKAAMDEGRLNLHGAWFSIASGELHWLDQATGGFGPVPVDGSFS